jgi:hypothetical protein
LIGADTLQIDWIFMRLFLSEIMRFGGMIGALYFLWGTRDIVGCLICLVVAISGAYLSEKVDRSLHVEKLENIIDLLLDYSFGSNRKGEEVIDKLLEWGKKEGVKITFVDKDKGSNKWI